MNITLFQHVDFEGPAELASLLPSLGHQINLVRLYRGEPVPDAAGMDGLIIMGGPMGVQDSKDYPWLPDEISCIKAVLEARKPVLGICLGAQLMAVALGARVAAMGAGVGAGVGGGVRPHREIGWFPLSRPQGSAPASPGDKLAGALTRLQDLTVFHWHGDTFDIPPGALHLAESAACTNQAFRWGTQALGLQFHLEVNQEALGSMVRNGGHELTPGPWIQDAEELSQGAREHGPCNLQVLQEIISALFPA